MGRKPLPADERQDDWIKFRVRRRDREALATRAKEAGLSLSDYLREKGLAS